MTPGPHLLVVDDEAGIRESLSSILEDEGYHVEAVGSAEEALDRAAAGHFEVVLLDVWLPGIDGLEALSRLQASPRPPAVIMISGHGADQRPGADLRRERHGQGTRCARTARGEPSQQGPFRGSQLRGDSRGADRVRTFRAHQGQLYRRDGRQDWKISKGRRRDAIPR